MHDDPTGFVRSTIYRVPGGLGSTPVSRNLNDQDGSHNAPVLSADALAQPTDVVTYEPSGGTLKVETLGLRANRPEIAAVNVAGEDEVRFTIPRDREGQVYFRITSPQAGTGYKLNVGGGKP